MTRLDEMDRGQATPLLPLEGLAITDKVEILRDLYKKHAAELLALEEAQQKLNALVLGIFSAGATLLASDTVRALVGSGGKLGLVLVTVAIGGLGGLYTFKRHQARGSVRLLLTRCEEALGCYDTGFLANGGTLYPVEFRQYKERGSWLAATFALALLSAVAFLIMLFRTGMPA